MKFEPIYGMLSNVPNGMSANKYCRQKKLNLVDNLVICKELLTNLRYCCTSFLKIEYVKVTVLLIPLLTGHFFRSSRSNSSKLLILFFDRINFPKTNQSIDEESDCRKMWRQRVTCQPFRKSSGQSLVHIHA